MCDNYCLKLVKKIVSTRTVWFVIYELIFLATRIMFVRFISATKNKDNNKIKTHINNTM